MWTNNHKHFIQAKLNQKDGKCWTLSDKKLKDELLSAKQQLQSDPDCEFHFYSQTPFGAFRKLIDESKGYPTYDAFFQQSPNNQKENIGKLAELWSLSDEDTFSLCRRIKIGSHLNASEWEKLSLQLLKSEFSNAQTAISHLWTFIDKQHSKTGVPLHVIDRVSVLSMLKKHGIYHVLDFNEQKLLQSFKQFSGHGRAWVRTIAGEKIERTELVEIKDLIASPVQSILLEDTAGGGKTCILLDLADDLEQQEEYAVLFIRGDHFSSISTTAELQEYGLPVDLVAQSARLAEKRKLVVIIDSLDVLAVGRSHQALQCFLRLADELTRVPNITVIAASRSIDIRYDPLLRTSKWEHRVTAEPLTFVTTISPLLEKWGVTPSGLAPSLQQLLTIPQNLRLFYSLIDKGVSADRIQGQELFDLYLREVVEKDAALGVEVVTALQNLAISLLQSRTYRFAKNRLPLQNEQIQRLISQEILTEEAPNELLFSHQTLADALRIRHAQQQGMTLVKFILSQPQFPFIRPAIRAFIQSLQAEPATILVKQLRQVLVHNNVSTHIKRLVVELLADMPARKEYLPVINQLSNQSPSLLYRFLSNAHSEQWFILLHDHWLSGLSSLDQKSLLSRFYHYSSQFKNKYPELLISLWHRAIDEQWLSEQTLQWGLPSVITELEELDNPEVERLLEKLLNHAASDRDTLGKAISRYVEASNKGDGLLWRYITKGTDLIEDARMGRDLKLQCSEHDFRNKAFLKNRLIQSSELFGYALELLLQYAEQDTQHYFSLLMETSWRIRHSCRSMHHLDDIHEFLDSLESALKFHAQKNDDCWQKYEPMIRHTLEGGIRYLLLEAYQVNIENNLIGIASQLTDPEMIRESQLRYELGTLTLKAYPLLPTSIHFQHQQLIMDMYKEEDFHEPWMDEVKFEILSWIPALYRTPEADTFWLAHSKKSMGYFREPDITSWGGVVSSPVSSEKLIELSSNALIKLLHHYNDYHDWTDHNNGRMTGNRGDLARALDTAASQVPLQFIPYIKLIEYHGLADEYIVSIIDGVATHIDARFGNTHHQEWKEVEPLPDGKALAQSLLSLVERYGNLDKRGYTKANAIKACAHVLTTENEVDRLCFQLWQLTTFNSPEQTDPDDVKDKMGLLHQGINSVRGRAADTAMVIANNLIEHKECLPDNLLHLLQRFAKDSVICVRSVLLRRFSYFLHHQPEYGWQLIGQMMSGQYQQLGPDLESCLYYNYRDKFEVILPHLEALKESPDITTGEPWGRIAALSYIEDHLEADDFWPELAKSDSENKRHGAGQVFIQNISNPQCHSACLQGVSKILSLGATDSFYTDLDHRLEKPEYQTFIPESLVDQFLETVSIESYRDFDGLLSWLSTAVINKPQTVLEFLERLIIKLEKIERPISFYRPENLLATLKTLLQEADTLDDKPFIDRVLRVQDWFIDNGVSEVEKLLEAF